MSDWRTWNIHMLDRPGGEPETHVRRLSCEEAGCERQRDGFAVLADESTPDGAARASYLRTQRRRPCIETRDEYGAAMFLFPPGTPCFEPHEQIEREPVDDDEPRPALYAVRDGWGPARKYDRGDQWMDDLHTTVDRIETIRQRG